MFPAIVGIPNDLYFQSMGVNQVQLRWISDPTVPVADATSVAIAPNPVYQHLGVQKNEEFPNEMNDAEALDTWEFSVPFADWVNLFGSMAALEAAMEPLNYWEIDYGVGWVRYRVFGEIKRGNIRHILKLVSLPFNR